MKSDTLERLNRYEDGPELSMASFTTLSAQSNFDFSLHDGLQV